MDTTLALYHTELSLERQQPHFSSARSLAPSSIAPITSPGAGRAGRGCKVAPCAPALLESAFDHGSIQHHYSAFFERARLFQYSSNTAVDGKLPCFEFVPTVADGALRAASCTYPLIFKVSEDNITKLAGPGEIGYPHERILTPVNALPDTMTTIASAPGSPPDLSESRSSKSSSTCSSQFTNPDGEEASDITNFEDIGLEGAQKVTAKSEVKAMPHVETAQRPPLAALQTEIKVSTRLDISGGWKKPAPGPAKRGFTSPNLNSSPTSAIRPRSSSPRRIPGSASNTTVRPNSGLPNGSLALHSRRGSWQPSRKSIQELEAEYHDSDDDLPEDASLWNVPMSPYPSGNQSSRSSARGSPEREVSRSPRPIPLAHAQTLSATPPPRRGSASQSLPKNRPPPVRTSALSTTLSNPPSPKSRRTIRDYRARSWNIAMSDLSEEARVISEALEYHAEAENREQEATPQSGARRKSVDSTSKKGTSSTAVQLPPIQTSNLDFMPISKEKEAILSRTRPSWLPPKDPREEKKHLKEYQRMMVASQEAEKRREEKLRQLRCEKDSTREVLNRIWDYYVTPTKDQDTFDKRVQELCWSGVSPQVRGKVWQRAVGNQLGLSTKSYQKALQRAKEIQSRASQDQGEREKVMLTWFTDIQRDAETAFPELNLFQRHGPLWQDLINVCEAYACYRSDVGYVYGMQLVAALLLLQLPSPDEVFVLLANCLNKPVPLAFQTNDVGSTLKNYDLATAMLGLKFPRVHQYLFDSVEHGGLAFRGEEIFEPMFRTLFSNGLDVDRLCRIWDVWVFEGDRTLTRTAVAIVGTLQTQIFDVRGDIDTRRRNIQEMLGWGPFNRHAGGGHWNLQSVGDEDALIEEVRIAGMLDYTGR